MIFKILQKKILGGGYLKRHGGGSRNLPTGEHKIICNVIKDLQQFGIKYARVKMWI
jgi:hypothetical protein